MWGVTIIADLNALAGHEDPFFAASGSFCRLRDGERETPCSAAPKSSPPWGRRATREEQLRALMEAGADVFRLNFSHGSAEAKSTLIRRIRELSPPAPPGGGDPRRPAGAEDPHRPDAETAALELIAGREVTDHHSRCARRGTLIPTTYRELPGDVRPGDSILMDDGLIELAVLQVGGEDVRCRVVVGGVLKDRKGMNLPGWRVSAPALTDKDREDLRFLPARSGRLSSPSPSCAAPRTLSTQGYSPPEQGPISG